MSASAADTLTIILGGDVLFDRGVRKVINAHGYDHMTDEQANIMEPLEIKILKSLGFEDHYQDRDYN